jgi:hypothetical protein
MRNIILAVALAAPIAALAQADTEQRIARMQATCEWQMLAGVCGVKNDDRPRLRPGRVEILGTRRIPAEQVQFVRDGDRDMCSIVAGACRSNPEGNLCHIGKTFWGWQ